MRPTETLTALVNTLVGAATGVIIAFYPQTAETLGKATPGIVILLAWVATVVTYFVARRLRNPESPLVSSADGSVQHEPVPDPTVITTTTAAS